MFFVEKCAVTTKVAIAVKRMASTILKCVFTVVSNEGGEKFDSSAHLAVTLAKRMARTSTPSNHIAYQLAASGRRLPDDNHKEAISSRTSYSMVRPERRQALRHSCAAVNFSEFIVGAKKSTRTKIRFFIWKMVRVSAGQRELKNLGGRTYPFRIGTGGPEKRGVWGPEFVFANFAQSGWLNGRTHGQSL